MTVGKGWQRRRRRMKTASTHTRRHGERGEQRYSPCNDDKLCVLQHELMASRGADAGGDRGRRTAGVLGRRKCVVESATRHAVATHRPPAIPRTMRSPGTKCTNNVYVRIDRPRGCAGAACARRGGRASDDSEFERGERHNRSRAPPSPPLAPRPHHESPPTRCAAHTYVRLLNNSLNVHGVPPAACRSLLSPLSLCRSL